MRVVGRGQEANYFVVQRQGRQDERLKRVAVRERVATRRGEKREKTKTVEERECQAL